ncbi:MAG: class I SAM-dependent methyltransferase [Chthoniobacterales bacterium]
MSVELEVRVPISPTPDFFRRVHFLAASLRQLERSIGSYLLVVCVGGDVEPHDLYEAEPWSKNYPIIWRWANREKFRRDGYWETSREIFRQPMHGRIIMCVDADVIFVRDFSDLLQELLAAPAVAGVIAHAPPVRGPALVELWPRLCAGYRVPLPPAIHEYTGWSFMTHDRMTPVYYNFGMVLMPAGLMAAVSAEMEPADDFVNANLETFFRFQIALTVAIQKAGLPSRALPLRYNFPNDPQFDARYPDELSEIRILHYLRCEIVHREENFRSLESVAALIARSDLRDSNEILRRRLAELYSLVEEEEVRPASKGNSIGPRLRSITVPDQLQRNAPDVLADGVEETGESLLRGMALRIGRTSLAGLNLLDVGCGVRFTQTLINRSLPFESYTGVEVFPPIVEWLKRNVEARDARFKFVLWDVQNTMYNPAARPMNDQEQLPVTGRYDIVMGFSLFTHLPPPDAASLLRLMRKAVYPTGFLYFSAFCDDAVDEFEDRVPESPLLNAYYNGKYLEKIIREAGWELQSHAEPAGYILDSFLCKPAN